MQKVVYYKFGAGEPGKNVQTEQEDDMCGAKMVCPEVATNDLPALKTEYVKPTSRKEYGKSIMTTKARNNARNEKLQTREYEDTVTRVQPKYYVKFSVDGIFNPRNFDARHRKMTVFKSTMRWKKVTKQCFDYYLTFLRTGKTQYLHYVEREAV